MGVFFSFHLINAIYVGPKKETFLLWYTHFFLRCLLLFFFSKFLNFTMKKIIVFIHISSNPIHHELLADVFKSMVMKLLEIFIFIDISKMSFRLDWPYLAVSNSFISLNSGMCSFFQVFPLFMDLHDLIFVLIFSAWYLYKHFVLCSLPLQFSQLYTLNIWA